MESNNSISISFDDFYANLNEDMSLEHLEIVLEKVFSEVICNCEGNPDELVHVVDDRGIRWMTVAEAKNVLENLEKNQEEEQKKYIQQALRSTSKILAQELKILLLIANHTLKRYRELQLIPLEEVQRTEPNLIRLGRQVCYLLADLRSIETRMKEIRQKHPILRDFESKVGLLLKMQREGLQQQACNLAQELAQLKKKYLIASRGLNSDTNHSMQVRMDLQRQKKNVLSWHRYIATQREGVLQTELQDIRKTIENLKFLLAKEASEKEKYQSAMSDEHGKAQKNENELQAVKKVKSVLIHEEKKTDAAIHHFQERLGVIEETAPKSESAPVVVGKQDETEVKQNQQHRMVSPKRLERE